MIKFKSYGFGNAEDTSPASSIKPTQNGSAPAEGAPIGAAGKRVLIVDDDQVFLKAMAAKLKSDGFQVSTASESAEAISVLGDQPMDVVLMDIHFPPDICNGGAGAWDGFQTMIWLRGSAATRGARFIMVSSSDTPAHRERARQLGAAGYLNKPVEHAKLMALVNGSN